MKELGWAWRSLVTWWWHHTALGNRDTPPFVLFVCQDNDQRGIFVDAADRQLRGHRWHPDVSPDRYEYVGRQRILFVTEVDAHAEVLEARRVPTFPAGHESRREGTRRVRIAVAAESGATATRDRPRPGGGARQAA